MRKLLGVWRGGGGSWVGRSAAGSLEGGGGVQWVPQHTPQNDPHDALIILNIHKWGKKYFQKNLPIGSGKVRRGGQVRVKKFFCIFQTFLNAAQNSEYRHIGWKKNTLSRRAKFFFSVRVQLRRRPFPPKSQIGERRVQKLWGGLEGGGRGGVWNSNRPPP